jgi:hypothetical protein
MSTDMKTKTQSAWITHVKAFAKENGLKYNEALRDPNLKVGYVKVERIKESKSSPKMEPMMEMNRSSINVEPVVVVKKGRKKKEMVMVEQPIVIQTEDGSLQQVPEAVPKKVRVKNAKKKEAVMM